MSRVCRRDTRKYQETRSRERAILFFAGFLAEVMTITPPRRLREASDSPR